MEQAIEGVLKPLKFVAKDKALTGFLVVLTHPQYVIEEHHETGHQRKSEAQVVPERQLEFDKLRNSEQLLNYEVKCHNI